MYQPYTCSAQKATQMLKFGGRGVRAKHVSHHTIAFQHHFSRLLRHPWLEMAYSYPPRPKKKFIFLNLKKNLQLNL